MNIRRGDIYYADLSPVVGSEQGGLRPVLIVQNDVGNRYSPTVIAAAITSRMGKAKLPTISIFMQAVRDCKKIRLFCWNKFARWTNGACVRKWGTWTMMS